MSEPHLAPASSAPMARDLSSAELWELSLERSRRRREPQAQAPPRPKRTAAAISAALLLSPILPLATATAGIAPGTPRSAPLLPATIDGVVASRGDTGGPVAALQRAVGVDDDGIFGPITERAVQDFQARLGLKRTGKVDLQTWTALLQSAGSTLRPQPASPVPAVAAPKRRVRVNLPEARSATGAARPLAEVTRGAPVTAPPTGECGEPLTPPVAGTLTSGFGDGRQHAGIDLSAPVGTPVAAAACGTVTRAAGESGYGRMICITHNATLSTCYAHLSEMAVQRGAYVEAGQVIGKVGMSGRSSGPHLHFETRVNGRAHDPASYLNR